MDMLRLPSSRSWEHQCPPSPTQHLLHPDKKKRRKTEGTRIHSQRQESASPGHTLLITTQTPNGWTMARPFVFANLFNIARQLTYIRTTLIKPVSQTTSRPRTMSGTPAK